MWVIWLGLSPCPRHAFPNKQEHWLCSFALAGVARRLAMQPRIASSVLSVFFFCCCGVGWVVGITILSSASFVPLSAFPISDYRVSTHPFVSPLTARSTLLRALQPPFRNGTYPPAPPPLQHAALYATVSPPTATRPCRVKTEAVAMAMAVAAPLLLPPGNPALPDGLSTASDPAQRPAHAPHP